MSNDIMPRATLEALLGHRDRALTLAAEAYELHCATLAKMGEAQKVANLAANGEYALHDLEKFIINNRDDAERTSKSVRQALDRRIWPSILRQTGLAGMMDKQARDEFERDLASDPPECTADNIRATFQQMRQNSRIIFRRGLVNVFKALSRDYRSNDGFKLGVRTVISYGVQEYGEYSTFADADRIMQILNGERIGDGWYSELGQLMRSNIKSQWRSKGYHSGESVIIPGEVTTRFWRVKWFQNKNVHLWCLRPDLLRRANRLIAEHFGEAVGAGPDAAGARSYTRAKPHHSEVEDFYETQYTLVSHMVKAADLRPGMDVLEPSAGQGAIVTGIMAEGINPDAVEVHPGRAEQLRDLLPPGCVIEMDFLKMHPEPEYDRVLMNPPFGKGAGVQHVFHAQRFLKPGGKLVAILGAGLEYREDGPSRELRALIKAWGGTIERMPAYSFAAAGTRVETVMLTMTKPSAAVAALPAPAAPTDLFAA